MFGVASRFWSLWEQKPQPHPSGPFTWEQERGEPLPLWAICEEQHSRWRGPTCLFNIHTLVKTTKVAEKSTNKKKTRCQKNAPRDTELSFVKWVFPPSLAGRQVRTGGEVSSGSFSPCLSREWSSASDKVPGRWRNERGLQQNSPLIEVWIWGLRELPSVLNFIFLFT